MPKKIWLFFGITLLLSGPVFSGTIESFCQEVTKPPTQKLKISMRTAGKFLTKFLFSPESLVEINKVSSSLNTLPAEKERKKFAFFLLPHTTLGKEEKKELRKIKKEQKSIRKRFKNKKFLSESDCLSFIREEDLEPSLLNLNTLGPRFLELKQKEIEEISYKQLSLKKKFLKKEGWKVFDTLSLFEVHKVITELSPDDVLFVAHASQDGRIYDTQKNAFPKTFFSRFPLDNLILYSCYGEESQEYYSFGDFNLFTASPTPFSEQFFSDSVPLQSLKTITKVKLESLKKSPLEKCLLEFPKAVDKFGVFLNGYFLGAVNQEISFPCSILREENSIEIYSVVKERHMGKSGLEYVFLNGEKIYLKDYINSKNRHIVTRSSYEIL